MRSPNCSPPEPAIRPPVFNRHALRSTPIEWSAPSGRWCASRCAPDGLGAHRLGEHQVLIAHRLQGVGGVRVLGVRDHVHREPDDAAGDARRRRDGGVPRPVPQRASDLAQREGARGQLCPRPRPWRARRCPRQAAAGRTRSPRCRRPMTVTSGTAGSARRCMGSAPGPGTPTRGMRLWSRRRSRRAASPTGPGHGPHSVAEDQLCPPVPRHPAHHHPARTARIAPRRPGPPQSPRPVPGPGLDHPRGPAPPPGRRPALPRHAARPSPRGWGVGP